MHAEDDVREVERHADERILAPLAPRTRTLPATAAALRTAEEGLEDVAEATESARSAPAERVVAAAVVLTAFFGVAQHVVRVRDELEALRRIRSRIHVGVQLARQTPVRLLDVFGARIARDAQHLVVVCHVAFHRYPATLGRPVCVR